MVTNLDETNLGAAVKRSLRRHGIETLEDLTKYSRQDLLRDFVFVGAVAVRHIEALLATKDLALSKVDHENLPQHVCPRCLKEYSFQDSDPQVVCPECKILIPPSLLKACIDPFIYAIKLRNGLIVQFQEAEIHGDWVTIRPNDPEKGWPSNVFEYPCPRGLDIRLSEIFWCADAPEGS